MEYFQPQVAVLVERRMTQTQEPSHDSFLQMQHGEIVRTYNAQIHAEQPITVQKIYMRVHTDIYLCILVTARQLFCFLVSSVECYAMCVQIMPLFTILTFHFPRCHNYTFSPTHSVCLSVSIVILYTDMCSKKKGASKKIQLSLKKKKKSHDMEKGHKIQATRRSYFYSLSLPLTLFGLAFCLYLYFFAGSLFLYRL